MNIFNYQVKSGPKKWLSKKKLYLIKANSKINKQNLQWAKQLLNVEPWFK